jgi:hypothetical protein
MISNGDQDHTDFLSETRMDSVTVHLSLPWMVMADTTLPP